MAEPADRLVGRATELRALEQALAELGRGRSGAIVLVGEPGIGKTSLLRELSTRADERGQIVLSGSASEFEQDLPFGVFVDALDEFVAGLNPNRLSSLGDDARAELVHVVPSLPAPARSPGEMRSPGGMLPDERHRTHRAVRRLVEAIAATKPLLLVLDDLHWADPGSIELLGTLLHRPPAAALLLAMALRSHRPPDRLSSALERAQRAGTLRRLELGVLSAEESGELLGSAVQRAELTALYAESGGNPFYLQQLARVRSRSTQSTRAVPEVSLVDVPVPPAVASALAEELALLGDGVRRALEGAAVAGDPFEPELAAAAAGLSEAAQTEALDELLRLDLVRRTNVPRRFRFRHPLVRRAVYEAAPGGWRLGAHARSAEALATRGASAAARAHHVEQAARHGDLAAVTVLSEAGQSLFARTPAGAARWFAAALRLLPDAAPPDERIGLQTALALALGATGRYADAHAVLLDSLAVVPDDAVTLRARLTADCAGMEQLLGRHDAAHRRLVAGLTRLPDSNSPEAVGMMLELAADCAYRMDYGAMRDWSQRALDTARPLDDRLLTARAAARLALSSAFSGAVGTGEASRVEVAALVDDMSDRELARCLERVVSPLAAAELYLDRYEEAGRHAERMLAVALATGRSHLVPVLFWAATVRTARGRLPEAVEVLDSAVEIARLSDNASALAWNLLGRSFAATAAGDVDTAVGTAEESVDVLRGSDSSLTSVWAAFALAASLLPSGDPARAAEVLTNAAGGNDMSHLPAVLRPGGCELLTRCWLALSRVDDAARAADAAAANARTLGLPMALVMADRAAAAVALDRGDPRHAADRALASATTAEEVGAPVEVALSRMLAGRALARAGEIDRAAGQLEGAAATLDTCAAMGHRDAAERQLRLLGKRHRHRRTRSGKPGGSQVESLTERELQVARLVVDRRTNSQIAGTLYLSPKTVETHIRNLFNKLEVTSRVEIARAIERADRAARDQDDTPR